MELLQHHLRWIHLKDILDNGATFPLLPISQQERNIDLEFHLNTFNGPQIFPGYYLHLRKGIKA